MKHQHQTIEIVGRHRTVIRSRRAGFIWPLLILSIVANVVGARSLFAAQPDMSHVTDILGGDHYLLRDDDLVFSIPFVFTDSNNYAAGGITAPTSNSSVDSSNAQNWFGGPDNGLPVGNFTPSSTVALARFYNSDHDDALTVTQQFNSSTHNYNWFARVTDFKTTTALSGQQIPSSFNPVNGPTGMRIVKGDFNGDGFQDAAIFYFAGPFPTSVGMNIATASDPQTNLSPLTIGPQRSASSGRGIVPLTNSLVAGDFSGGTTEPPPNGIYDADGIAALMTDNQTVQFFSVNPQTLEISRGQSIKLPIALGYNAPGGFIAGSLVAGRFRPHHQIRPPTRARC